MQADTTMLEAQLVRFFDVNSADHIPYLAHAARKSNYEHSSVPPAQLAWLFRVRHIAKSISVPRYSEAALKEALNRRFRPLLLAPEDAREVPKILTECGVRFILVEKLPGAEIDGVCFWLDNAPVICMTTRYDRIDNFWFVLRHESEHVLRRHGREQEIIDDLDGERASATDSAIPEEERIANAAAGDFCAPADKLDSFMLRKRPFFYERDVIAFARLHQRHPGLVVGQMRHRMKRHDYLTRYLVKIRQFVLRGAITDGWGQVVPVTL
jgi:HTH-type transcriptional regulator/antitoxin HigA